MKGSFLYLLYILNNYQINLYTCIIDENESKYSLLTSSRIIESEKKTTELKKETITWAESKAKFMNEDERIVNYESNLSNCCRSLSNVRSDEQSARELRFRSDSALAIFTRATVGFEQRRVHYVGRNQRRI